MFRKIGIASVAALIITAFTVPQPADAAMVELLTNGSFETGGFTGWATVTTDTPYLPWAVTGSGSGGGFGIQLTAPQDGAFVAWNGFDGNGPMEFQLYQDVVIPNAVTATLSWMHRVQWDFRLGETATLERLFDVEIRNPTTNAILGNPFSFSTGTQTTNPTGDTGWLTTSADLSSFAGSTIRLFFRERVPQSDTGPAQLEFDAISLTAETAVPEPSTWLLFGAALALMGVVRRRKSR